jgi:hypothetical protein
MARTEKWPRSANIASAPATILNYFNKEVPFLQFYGTTQKRMHKEPLSHSDRQLSLNGFIKSLSTTSSKS